MQSLKIDAFNAFHSDWALLTAGTIQDFNTMTISWGGLGVLWKRPVATVYVRPCRHTYLYMEKSDYFTISFYPEEYRKDLTILGTLSGANTNKVTQTALIPAEIGNSVTFQQAKLTLICRKIYAQSLEPEAIPEDILRSVYGNEEPHKMYIGEVLQIITNE